MFLIVLLILCISCKTVLSGDNTSKVVQETRLSSNTAAINFYQIISKKDGNALFCPVSLNIILALTTIAAKGETATELKSALHLNMENKYIKSGYKELLKNVGVASLKLATRFFLNTGAVIDPGFVQTAQKYFNSDVQTVDYANGKVAANLINTFVEKNTNNKIHDLVSAGSFSSSTGLLLVNAAHFKGDWLNSFEHVFEKKFSLTKDKNVVTKMMQRTYLYSHAEIISLDANMVQIPYKKDDFSMLIILPNKIDGLHEMEMKLKNFNIEDIYNNLTLKNVELTMPKFKIENTIDLKRVCQKQGIRTLFTSGADLTGLGKNRISASGIIQKSLIQVDEIGVEAAAATGVQALAVSKSQTTIIGEDLIVFTADHPFLFLLMKGKIILFLGRLTHV